MELELGLQLLVQALPALAQIFTALQEERLSILKHEQTKDLQKVKSNEVSPKPHENRDIQKWGFEQEKSLQQEIALYNRETLLKLADSGREIVLKFLETQKIQDNWPLRLLPSQFLVSRNSEQPLPLRIFLAPLKIQGDAPTIADIEPSLAQGLREFLSQHYPLDSQKRPTEFIAGAWKNQHFNREASIKALFEMLKSEPTLILESEIVGDYLNFRIAYWGLGQKTYCYKTIISKLSYWEIVYAAAKKRAWKWKETANKLLACGETLEEVKRLGGDNVANLEIMEKEERWQQLGIDCSELYLKYKVNSKDFAALSEFLITYHCLIASWVADAHHLINGEVPPLLPDLLPDLTRDISQERSQALIRSTISCYRDIFTSLENEQPVKVSELALKLARSLAVLPDKYWAKEFVEYSLEVWLKQRQLPENRNSDPLETIQSFIAVEDREYLENIKDCLITVGDDFCLAQVCRLLRVLEDLQSKTKLENVPIAQGKTEKSIIKIGSNLSAIAKFKRNFQPENVSIIHTLTGHSGKASSIAVSLDGSTLASGSEDNTIKLWQLGTGELLHTFNANSGRVLAINLSPDGEILASSHRTSDRSCIKIWQLQTGELLHTLTGHHKWIYSLAISPDAQTLVSGSHKIKTWHLGTGEPLHTLVGHKEWVYSLAISPDGQKFVSSGADKIIKVWHLHTGELIRTLEGHLDWIRSVVISPNGDMLASGSDDNTIKIWNLNSGKLFHTLKGHSDWVLSLAISPDGETLISGGKDHTIKLWHLETGKLLGTLKGHKKWVYSLAISPDGQTFASGSEDKTINIWRAV